MTEFSLPKESGPEAITEGPEGDLWFCDTNSSKIGKITTWGEITEYSLPKVKRSCNDHPRPRRESLVRRLLHE